MVPKGSRSRSNGQVALGWIRGQKGTRLEKSQGIVGFHGPKYVCTKLMYHSFEQFNAFAPRLISSASNG